MAGPEGLDKRVVGIAFNQGMETREDPRLVVPGKLLLLQNGSLGTSGAINRRDSWSDAGSATGALNGLALYNNELLEVSGSSLLSYGSSFPTARGTISNAQITKSEVVRSPSAQDEFDVATTGSITCYVWRESNASGSVRSGRVMIRDEVTGSVAMAPTSMRSTTAITCLRVVAMGSVFLILYGDATNLYARAIAYSAPTVLGAEVTLRTDFLAAVNPVFDCCLIDTTVGVAYPTNNATNAIHAIVVSVSGTVPSVTSGPTGVVTQANLAFAAAKGIACADFSSTAWGVYVSYDGSGGGALAAGVYGAVLSATASISQAFALLNAGAAPTAAGSSRITAVLNGTTMSLYSDNLRPASALTYIFLTTTNVANAVLSTNNTWQPSGVLANGISGPFIAGKAFVMNGANYLPVQIMENGTGALQATWMLLDSNAAVMARALYGTYSPIVGQPPSTPRLSQTVAIAPVGEKTLLSFSSGTNVSLAGFTRLSITFQDPNTPAPPLAAQLEGNTFFAGGVLCGYDSLQAAEAAFHLFPEVVSVADLAAGAITAGARQYVALYEWVDGAGQRHQSAPSVAVSYTGGANRSARVTIPTLLVGVKASTVNIVVFRTADTGSTFYRLNAVTAPVANSLTAVTVTYDDNTTDAALTAGELLYTTGGALPNNAPPACTILAVHQNRLFINSENPREWRFSQVAVAGFGLQWNETLGGLVPADAGDLKAMGALDDKLILFCALKAYVLLGVGPTSAGAQSSYQLQEVMTDASCIEPRSVLRMPQGLIFQARKGMHLLGRDLTVRYIGSGVETYKALTISSAVLMDDRKECRFTLTSGPVLVYSYMVDQWSVYSGYNAVGAVWWPVQGAFWFCTAGGVTRGDGGAETFDNTTPIVLTIKTGWLKPGDALQGLERIWALHLTGSFFAARQLTCSTLSVSCSYDYDTESSDFVTVADTIVLKNITNDGWELRWRLPRQKFSAVQFQIIDTPLVESNGLNFTGMDLECGVKRGARKLPAGKTV